MHGSVPPICQDTMQFDSVFSFAPISSLSSCKGARSVLKGPKQDTRDCKRARVKVKMSNVLIFFTPAIAINNIEHAYKQRSKQATRIGSPHPITLFGFLGKKRESCL